MSSLVSLPGRTVGVRRLAGLGDVLLSTAAAWRYARATGRTLDLDWRHSLYSEFGVNLFTCVFQPLREWGGVPVWLPPVDARLDAYDRLTAAQERAEGQRSCALVKSGDDLPDDHVVLRGCVAPEAPPPAVLAALLKELRLQPDLAAAVDADRATLLGVGPSIGVHLRHGNGGDIMGFTPYWADGLALHRVTRAVVRARAVLGQSTPVFLATDSLEIQEAFTALVSDVRTTDKRFRSTGEGELHRWSESHTTLIDAVRDMWLLARTTALIRMPPRSYFSTPAAVLKSPAPAELLDRSPALLAPAVW